MRILFLGSPLSCPQSLLFLSVASQAKGSIHEPLASCPSCLDHSIPHSLLACLYEPASLLRGYQQSLCAHSHDVPTCAPHGSSYFNHCLEFRHHFQKVLLKKKKAVSVSQKVKPNGMQEFKSQHAKVQAFPQHHASCGGMRRPVSARGLANTFRQYRCLWRLVSSLENTAHGEVASVRTHKRMDCRGTFLLARITLVDFGISCGNNREQERNAVFKA